jgi:hypothetical protein
VCQSSPVRLWQRLRRRNGGSALWVRAGAAAQAAAAGAVPRAQVLHGAVQHFQQAAEAGAGGAGGPAAPLETSQGIGLLALLQQLRLRHPRPDFQVARKQRGQCRWAVRPLTLEMLEYAVGDVLHLPAAAAALEQQLWRHSGLAMAARVCEGLLVEGQGVCMYGQLGQAEMLGQAELPGAGS